MFSPERSSGVLGDVVDSVDLWSLRLSDSLRDPRGGDVEEARHSAQQIR